MSRSRIIPSSLRLTLLSRKPSASVLRPPSLIRRAARTTTSHSRLGLHPNNSHLSLPPFAALRAFSTTPPRLSQAPSFTYSLSAAYSDKRHKLDLQRNYFTFDPNARISRDRIEDGAEAEGAIDEHDALRERPRSGQDSYFISNIGESTTGNVAFGVVDGVGGWEESGVDPADFAHGICDYMSDAASRYPYGYSNFKSSNTQGGSLRPVDLLQTGYEKVMRDPSIPAGGCTACLATLSPSGLLSVANLGDSGYIHLSPFRLGFLSPAQTHRFNTPFQLSKLPPKMLEQVALFGGAKPYSELPGDSALSSRQVGHGDVVVFATDGVWDNLSAEDALRLVSRLMVRLGAWIEDTTPNVSPDLPTIIREAQIKVPSSQGKADANGVVRGLSAVLATALVHEAKVASLDRKRDGPFAKEVQRLYPEEEWTGGKADDICVVVGVICQEGM